MGGFSQRTRKVCSVPRDSERGRKGSGKIQRGQKGSGKRSPGRGGRVFLVRETRAGCPFVSRPVFVSSIEGSVCWAVLTHLPRGRHTPPGCH